MKFIMTNQGMMPEQDVFHTIGHLFMEGARSFGVTHHFLMHMGDTLGAGFGWVPGVAVEVGLAIAFGSAIFQAFKEGSVIKHPLGRKYEITGDPNLAKYANQTAGKGQAIGKAINLFMMTTGAVVVFGLIWKLFNFMRIFMSSLAYY